MNLSDRAVERLREAVREPELTGTRYQLVRRVGTGGMGAVYEAVDVTLGRRVALKVLEIPDPEGCFARHLSREARILASLEHPGIVPVHDAGTLADGRVYYAMKLVAGARLDEHLSRVSSLAGKLRLFLRALDAVAFAHSKGVLHRDLKPSNIMVGPFGEVLVMDWGLAKQLAEKEDEGLSVVGSPGFMSPEQAAGLDLDVRADVYSLGSVLRAILHADGALRVPRALGAIVARATASEPSARYADVASLSADILRYLDGERVDAHAEGLADRVTRLLKRHRVAVILVLAYLSARALMIFWPR